MSSLVQAEVWKRYPVGGGEMMLALALADHASDDGTRIFPSVRYSAEKTRQSERSVQLQLRRMVQRDFLILVEEAKFGRTREYKINPKWLAGGELRPLSVSDVPEVGEISSPPHVDKLSSVESGGCNSEHGDAKFEAGVGEIHDKNHASNFTPTSSNHQEKVFNHHPPPVDKVNPNHGAPAEPLPNFSSRQLFEIFIREYPASAKRAGAWEEFDRLRPSLEVFGWMMRTLALQKRTDGWNSEGGRWIPYPANWLRKQAWKSWHSTRVDKGGQWLRTLLGADTTSEPLQKPQGLSASAYISEIKKTVGG